MIKRTLLGSIIFGLINVAMAASVSTPTTSTTPSVNASTPSGYSAAQQSVLTASEDWQQAIDARNPKAIAALYDPQTLFYPTFATEITTPQALYQYFVNLTLKPQLQVIYDQENPRVYGDGTVAVNSGLYTFSYMGPHHKTVKVPARFTFVYLKENGQWMIVEHHSSEIPQKQKTKH